MTQCACGKNVVKQLPWDGKSIRKVLIQEGIRDTVLEGGIKKRRIPVKVLGREKMDQLLNGSHQGIAICIGNYRIWELEELLESVPQGKQPLLMMLGGLEGPYNLGMILRTHDRIRADGVITGRHHGVYLTPMVAGASTGAIGTVKVSVVTNLVQAIKYLEKQGYQMVGTDFENSRGHRERQYDVPLVPVIGSEDFGINSLVKKNCDYCVRLPMEGSINSLSASVAAGILLCQIHTQRYPL